MPIIPKINFFNGVHLNETEDALLDKDENVVSRALGLQSQKEGSQTITNYQLLVGKHTNLKPDDWRFMILQPNTSLFLTKKTGLPFLLKNYVHWNDERPTSVLTTLVEPEHEGAYHYRWEFAENTPALTSQALWVSKPNETVLYDIQLNSKLSTELLITPQGRTFMQGVHDKPHIYTEGHLASINETETFLYSGGFQDDFKHGPGKEFMLLKPTKPGSELLESAIAEPLLITGTWNRGLLEGEVKYEFLNRTVYFTQRNKHAVGVMHAVYYDNHEGRRDYNGREMLSEFYKDAEYHFEITADHSFRYIVGEEFQSLNTFLKILFEHERLDLFFRVSQKLPFNSLQSACEGLVQEGCAWAPYTCFGGSIAPLPTPLQPFILAEPTLIALLKVIHKDLARFAKTPLSSAVNHLLSLLNTPLRSQDIESTYQQAFPQVPFSLPTTTKRKDIPEVIAAYKKSVIEQIFPNVLQRLQCIYTCTPQTAAVTKITTALTALFQPKIECPVKKPAVQDPTPVLSKTELKRQKQREKQQQKGVKDAMQAPQPDTDVPPPPAATAAPVSPARKTPVPIPAPASVQKGSLLRILQRPHDTHASSPITAPAQAPQKKVASPHKTSVPIPAQEAQNLLYQPPVSRPPLAPLQPKQAQPPVEPEHRPPLFAATSPPSPLFSRAPLSLHTTTLPAMLKKRLGLDPYTEKRHDAMYQRLIFETLQQQGEPLHAREQDHLTRTQSLTLSAEWMQHLFLRYAVLHATALRCGWQQKRIDTAMLLTQIPNNLMPDALFKTLMRRSKEAYTESQLNNLLIALIISLADQMNLPQLIDDATREAVKKIDLNAEEKRLNQYQTHKEAPEPWWENLKESAFECLKVCVNDLVQPVATESQRLGL